MSKRRTGGLLVGLISLAAVLLAGCAEAPEPRPSQSISASPPPSAVLPLGQSATVGGFQMNPAAVRSRPGPVYDAQGKRIEGHGIKVTIEVAKSREADMSADELTVPVATVVDAAGVDGADGRLPRHGPIPVAVRRVLASLRRQLPVRLHPVARDGHHRRYLVLDPQGLCARHSSSSTAATARRPPGSSRSHRQPGRSTPAAGTYLVEAPTTAGLMMASKAQRDAARRNVKKARDAAGSKRTIANLPEETRKDLGRQGAKARSRGGKAGRRLEDRGPPASSTSSRRRRTSAVAPQWASGSSSRRYARQLIPSSARASGVGAGTLRYGPGSATT